MKIASIRAVCLLLVAGAASVAAASAPARHLALVKSEPGKDSTVTVAPTKLRMYWTQPPQLAVTTVRLTTGVEETPVQLAAPRADEQDAKIIDVAVEEDLAPGTYTVTWRTAGDDGHVINGNYAFTYRAAVP